jgi:hypothetical protein
MHIRNHTGPMRPAGVLPGPGCYDKQRLILPLLQYHALHEFGGKMTERAIRGMYLVGNYKIIVEKENVREASSYIPMRNS